MFGAQGTMNAKLLLVVCGLIVQASWSVASYGEETTNGSASFNLTEGSMKEIARFVLDGKDGVLKYSVMADASGLESCKNSQGIVCARACVCVCVCVCVHVCVCV